MFLAALERWTIGCGALTDMKKAARARCEGGGYAIPASGQGTWKVDGEKAARQFGERETAQISAFGR